MSIFDWYLDYLEVCVEKADFPDDPCLQMFDLFDRSGETEDVEQALAYLTQAKAIADGAGEEEFSLWCDVFIAQKLANLLRYDEALRLLSESVVRSRQKRFNRTPQQIMVNVGYLGKMTDIDPAGYMSQIEESAKYLREIAKSEPMHLYVMDVNLIWALNECGRRDEADSYLSSVASHAHAIGEDYYHHSHAVLLAKTAYRAGDYDLTLEILDHSDDLETNSLYNIASQIMKRACCYARAGELDSARRQYNKSWKTLNCPADLDFCRFACEFQRLIGQEREALKLWETFYHDSLDTGVHWSIACAAEQLVLGYQTLGETAEAALWERKLRDAAGNLRAPDRFFEREPLIV